MTGTVQSPLFAAMARHAMEHPLDPGPGRPAVAITDFHRAKIAALVEALIEILDVTAPDDETDATFPGSPGYVAPEALGISDTLVAAVFDPDREPDFCDDESNCDDEPDDEDGPASLAGYPDITPVTELLRRAAR